MSRDQHIPLALFCSIVNFGSGSRLLHFAKIHGATGGTILIGKGTVNNRILEILGLSDIQKEIVLIATDEQTACHILDQVNTEFKLEKTGHGIAFVIPINFSIGSRKFPEQNSYTNCIGDNTMYQLITVIVEKGKAEEVVDAATEAGSTGGTIINGRGSGIHETSKLFSMEVEPEKEIVLILSVKEKTEAIVTMINEKLTIEKPGNGILFVQDVTKSYGLYG